MLTLTLLAALALSTTEHMSSAPLVKTCSAVEIARGECPVLENTGTEVVISGERPGDSQTGNAWPEGDGYGDDSDDTPASPETTPPAPATPPVDDCRPTDPASCTVQPDPPPAIPQPTLSDVARFAPASAPLIDEPDGVGVVGMPMNFVVDATTHEVTGTLFDLPVTVRFTPTSVLFVHGDGTSRESDDGGQSWATLGLAQFSATSTSHAYSTRGTYTASAAVRYAADVNFGGGWITVPGTLEIPTTAGDVQIFEVRTALVDKTCLENPSGIGC